MRKIKTCPCCFKDFNPNNNHDILCPECEETINKQDEFIYNNSYNQITNQNKLIPSMRPAEIKAQLDEYVVGQNDAKKILSTAVYNHIKRLNLKSKNPQSEIEKSNVIMVGPSGSGKTHMIKHLAQMFELPYCICDATTLTESGYVGADVETILQKLYHAADEDIEQAERGIVFIDEIDKKAVKSQENNSITRDVSGEGVQQALLKIIEGSKVDVQLNGERRNPYQETVTIDTSNILFIVSGAFPGIEKIIENRIVPKSSTTISFGTSHVLKTSPKNNYNDLINHLEHQDLQKFGLIPELLGRLPVICPVQQLDEELLSKILTEPKNALIKQYQELMLEDNIKLTFTKDAIKEIAKFAIKNNTGARGLRTHLEKLLLDSMFKLQDSNITINKKYVTDHLSITHNSKIA